MVREINGTQLCRRIEYTCKSQAQYEYVNEQGKRTPEYAATHIRIRSYFYTMDNGATLDRLATDIANMNGCIDTTIIRDHKTLRPQIVAIFNRIDTLKEDN